MQDFIHSIVTEFERNKNKSIALGQKAYMRNQFDFFGIKTKKRRSIQKPFFVHQYLLPKADLAATVKSLWKKPQREYQYFAQELASKYTKQLEPKDIDLYEYMVTHKSWWDTVDFIAIHLIGAYFKKYPQRTSLYVQKWLKTDNLWLQRSALLFQLKYKSNLDEALLRVTIHALMDSKEFFLQKAIGWVLREYSKTNPEWVKDFVDRTVLSPLSKREALRLMI